MKKLVVLGTFLLLMGTIAFAQDTKVEIDGYYSYFRFNPENSGTLNSHSLNGGGGDVAFYFSHMIGIKAEFAGYQSSTVTFSSPTLGTASASANLFTYNVGPIFKFRSHHLEPFGEVLFGGAHSSFYGNLCKQLVTCVVNNPSNNAWDFVMGGGLDYRVTEHWTVRPVEADYVLTRFGNGFTQGNQNQSNFRYQAGIQYHF